MRESHAASNILWNPENVEIPKSQIEADLIAVHGLGSLPERAWVHPRTATHWLRDQDMLPREMQTCRIISIHHDSRWNALAPIQSLRDYSHTILESLDALRQDKTEVRRPIIFVGYSFGGILIKKMLTIAREDSSQYDIAQSVRACIFLGTPHKGSNFAVPGSILSHLTHWIGSRSELLELLLPNSKELDDMHHSFLSSYRQIHIFNFFETQPIDICGLPAFLVVPRSSATIDGFSSIALQGNHFGLNKYESRQDRNYLLVLSALRRSLQSNGIEDAMKMPKLFSVPFRLRNAPILTNFVGRGALLKELNGQTFDKDHVKRRKIVVLFGMGGVGKTQIAIEHAIQNQNRYTAVAWLNGKTEESLKVSIAGFAEQIPLPAVLDGNGKLHSDESSLQAAVVAVRQWLEARDNSNWLLIIDNVDKQAFQNEESDFNNGHYDLSKHLPSCSQGTIILTSRLSKLAQFGTGISVGEVSADDGIQMLRNFAGQSVSDVEEASVIVQRLSGLPLAICSAGAYIQETGISMQKYIARHENFLSQIMHRTHSIAYENGSVATSWQLSLFEVRKRSTAAAGLLQIWSFIDNSDLWWDMLNIALECPKKRTMSRHLPPLLILDASEIPHSSVTESPRWLQEIADNEVAFLEAIRVLLEFSLVRSNRDTQSYSIHPLVHDWIRNTVHRGLWDTYLNAAASILGRCVPLAHHENASALARRLSPHVDRLWVFLDRQTEMEYTSADGFDGIAIHEFDRSHFPRAKRAWEIGCGCWERQAGLRNPLTLQCYFDCALAYRALGDLQKAESRWVWILEQCISIKQSSSSPDPVLVEVMLRALDDLGRLFALRQLYSQAVDYFRRAIALKIKALGAEDALTLDSERQLALTLHKQGNVDESGRLHQKVLIGFERACGPSSIWTLLAKSDLGAHYLATGRVKEADVLLEEAFQTMELQLGPLNEKTRETASNLALLYKTQGKETSLEALKERIVLTEVE